MARSATEAHHGDEWYRAVGDIVAEPPFNDLARPPEGADDYDPNRYFRRGESTLDVDRQRSDLHKPSIGGRPFGQGLSLPDELQAITLL